METKILSCEDSIHNAKIEEQEAIRKLKEITADHKDSREKQQMAKIQLIMKNPRRKIKKAEQEYSIYNADMKSANMILFMK